MENSIVFMILAFIYNLNLINLLNYQVLTDPELREFGVDAPADTPDLADRDPGEQVVDGCWIELAKIADAICAGESLLRAMVSKLYTQVCI